jgi:fluoride exporter
VSHFDWVALAALGGTGAVLRYAIDAWLESRNQTAFPVGTFAINIIGSFVLGVLTRAHVTDEVLFVAGTGLIGSFTTFSTWMFETQRLAEAGKRGLAGANVAATLAAGLVAAGAGWAVAALL